MPSFTAASSMVSVVARMRRMCSASSCSSVIASGADGRGAVPPRMIWAGRFAGAIRASVVEDHGPLDRVAQLADVSRPGVMANRLPHRLAEAGNVLAVLPGEELQQVLGQGQDVGRSLRAAAAR